MVSLANELPIILENKANVYIQFCLYYKFKDNANNINLCDLGL